MKKFTWLIALAALAGIIIFFQSKVDRVENSNTPSPTPINNQDTQKASPEVLFTTSTISQSDAFYKIKAEYPQFDNISASFSQKIDLFMKERVGLFKSEAAEAFPAGKNPDVPFDFTASWKEVQANDKYISFVIKMGYYVGGATGNEESRAFNYDIVGKKEITINDFLAGSQNALNKLSEISEQKVASKIKSTDVPIDQFIMAAIRAGTAPDWENFKEFNFTNNSLVVYFQKYQVAPGAAGSIAITITKPELAQAAIFSDYLK